MLKKYDVNNNKLTINQLKYFNDTLVKDDSHKLLIQYHGSNARFDEFKYGDIGFHFGTYEQAKDRGSIIKPFYLLIRNPFIINKDLMQWDPFSIALYLLFDDQSKSHNYYKNPELLAKTTKCAKSEFNNNIDELKSIIISYNMKTDDIYNCHESKLLRQIFKSKFYDGIKYINEQEGTYNEYSYIIFDSNQAKSIYNQYPTLSNNINEDLEYNNVDIESIKDKISKIYTYYEKYNENNSNQNCMLCT